MLPTGNRKEDEMMHAPRSNEKNKPESEFEAACRRLREEVDDMQRQVTRLYERVSPAISNMTTETPDNPRASPPVIAPIMEPIIKACEDVHGCAASIRIIIDRIVI